MTTRRLPRRLNLLRVVDGSAKRVRVARRALCVLLGIAAFGFSGCIGPTEPRVDLLIHGGMVVDGTGSPRRAADVAIRGGRIIAIESSGVLDPQSAKHTIDATGHVIAPGFVDIHSHADLIVLGEAPVQRELLSAKLRQGVTTLIVGNCGLGTAPTNHESAALLAGINGWMTPFGIDAGPLSAAAYLDRLERNGTLLNVGTLVPHGPLRISVMGAEGAGATAPTAPQLQRMRSELSSALDAGAWGLSAGLIYPPGMYSDTDELAALAQSVAAGDGLFAMHIRGSSETLIAATDELIELARRTGARVHHSHLEAVGERFWPGVAKVLAREDQARTAGLQVSHDVFPYTRAATMMSAVFPPWALDGGMPALLERLGSPPTAARIERELTERVPEWPPWKVGGWPHNLVGAVGWDGILVASVGGSAAESELESYVGQRLSEIGRAAGKRPFEVLVDLMQQANGEVGQLVDEISGREDELTVLRDILRHPAGAIISDAEDYGRGAPHPAHAGAFARALRWNHESQLMSLEALVRRMTAYPADIIGLGDRGRLAPGKAADLVIFDPQRVRDRATWDAPRLTAVGIDWVIVNGTIVVDRGALAPGLHGLVLRRPS